MTVALLISTYNWPEALDLVLRSVKNQSVMPNEILIADDGSTEITKKLIEKFQEEGLPIKHFWQEDKGFRKSQILNKAIAGAKSDYIIQVDGDCILHRNFVEDHKQNAEIGNFLFGSRVNIKEDAIEKVLPKRKIKFSFFSGKISKRTRNLRVPFLSSFYKETDILSKKVRGCNISYWRSDFIAINGYNEAMTGWGKEDSEMVVRLLNNGINGRRLRYAGIVYHIWHIEKSREREVINSGIQAKAIENKLTRCENGIDQYLSAPK
ncbi:glycosyltransferase family 2 protein [Gramella jeungdoensis]|uniref:Glycosyltransferase family 2 protein n=1 Tax=Gramella jeungdoensis TaxID=708091 RepID=A0ABT0YYG1_9FLAO|nr:glycosyltransferase family 2 protein [Gramella jeungdoensis]MCM8568165.1 glycosyltransferase family 2 protein [Gramella jeungdoensis]